MDGGVMDTQVPAPMTPRQEELYRTLPGRYRKVLADVAAGFTDGEIADRWHMSEGTVAAYLNVCCELLEVPRSRKRGVTRVRLARIVWQLEVSDLVNQLLSERKVSA